MIELNPNPVNPAKPWRLTYAEKCYAFATERDAEVALLLHMQADQVSVRRDGKSPAATMTGAM
jgi:hypothetical protein